MKELKKKSPPLLENNITIKKNTKEQLDVIMSHFRMSLDNRNLFNFLKQHSKGHELNSGKNTVNNSNSNNNDSSTKTATEKKPIDIRTNANEYNKPKPPISKKNVSKTVGKEFQLKYRTINTKKIINQRINHYTNEEGLEGLSMTYSGLRLSKHGSKLILHTAVKTAGIPKKVKSRSAKLYYSVKSHIQFTKKRITFVRKNITDFKLNQKQLTPEQRNMLKNFPLNSLKKIGFRVSQLSKATLKGVPKVTFKTATGIPKSGTAITQSIVIQNEEDLGLQTISKADEIWTGTKSVTETINNTTKFVSNLTGKKDLKHQKKKDIRKTKRTAQRNSKSQKLLKKRKSKTSTNTKKFVDHSETKKTAQMTKATIQNIKWIAKQGAVIIKQGITLLTSLLSNPIALGVIGAVIAIVLIFNIFLSFATTLLSVVTADDETISAYSTEIRVEYDAFNEKLSKIIDKALSDGYETANIVYATDTGTADSDILLPILSVLSVKYEQNLTCSSEEIQDIKNCINMFYSFTEERSTSYCDGCQSSTTTDAEWNEVTTNYCPGHKHLTIYVTVKDFDELLEYLGFDETQKEWATNIYTEEENQKYSSNVGGGPCISGEYLTPEQINALKNNAPKVNFTREELVRTALSINTSSYSISYFWGGKSAAGINPLWGTLKLVTAANNSNTGKYIPYGLDCSGYTSWCYLTAFDVYETDPAILKYAGFLKDGTAHQFSNATYAISRSELKIGDLVFKDRPNAGGVNHVGIYIGKGFDGRGIYAHCSGSSGTTVNSWSGFKYFRRPYIKFKGEY